MNLLFAKKSTPLGDVLYNKRHLNRNLSRVEAIVRNAVSGYKALDIGCNAGYFSRALLNENLVEKVDAIEYDARAVPENLKSDPRFSLYEGDAIQFPFKCVYDTTVYGAVHHHIVANHGNEIAMKFWQQVIKHTKSTIFIESGQLTEGSRWYWQRELLKYYSTDEQYFADLIYAVGHRLKSVSVVDYHFIHGVRRWLIKIELSPGSVYQVVDFPELSNIDIESSLYRSKGSSNQGLFSISEIEDDEIYRGVEFGIGFINKTKKVFCKKHIIKEKENYEILIAKQINDKRFIVPIGVSKENGLVFPYMDSPKVNDLKLHSLLNKDAFKSQLISLYDYAVNKDVSIQFSGNRNLKLIDVIDLHQSNIFYDENNNLIKVCDLEFYSIANRYRNFLHFRKILYKLDRKSFIAALQLVGAFSQYTFFLMSMSFSKPDKLILYRVENIFSWVFIKLRNKLDQYIAAIFPNYLQ